MFETNNKKQTLNFGGYLFLAVSVYCIYYLLIEDNLLNFSVSPILDWTSQNAKHLHVLAIALVPIYVALMVFGAALISTLIGSALQRWVVARWLRM